MVGFLHYVFIYVRLGVIFMFKPINLSNEQFKEIMNRNSEKYMYCLRTGEAILSEEASQILSKNLASFPYPDVIVKNHTKIAQ